jgi:CHAD domain-containing protein
LKQQEQAAKKLSSESIHDLRIALRRSRSLAEGFSELDTHADWRHLRRTSKSLQSRLAELRDLQVMREWIQRLGIGKESDGARLSEVLSGQEDKARHKARAALKDFSRNRWKKWKRRMPARADALPFNEPHFAALALRRLGEAQELDRQRRRNPSGAAVHRLRIAVKKFRYTVESFLPEQQKAWGETLWRLQRLLGEVHDLDVLRGKLRELGPQSNPHSKAEEDARARQTTLIEKAREERMNRFDKLTSAKQRPNGSKVPHSALWDGWKRELESLTQINLPESAAPSRSTAKRVKRSAAKANPAPGRRLRLS